ncbi:MAG: hypothetical protein AAF630_00995 [Cyanobacteria bacterium P01_C01_bin.38]
MRASCSLSVSSEQDARTIKIKRARYMSSGHASLTHYQIVFLQNRDAPVEFICAYLLRLKIEN